MLSTLLDSEWLLSTLFDASLLTFEPPETAAPFFVLSRFGPLSGPAGDHKFSSKPVAFGGPAAAVAVPPRRQRL
jgi:hypothetical protein